MFKGFNGLSATTQWGGTGNMIEDAIATLKDYLVDVESDLEEDFVRKVLD